MEPITRTCNACGNTKPLVEFYAHRGCRHGREPRCKTCARTQAREYARTHKRIGERRYDFQDLPDYQRAYLAGFIDGEGYLGVNFRNTPTGRAFYPRIAIVNTHEGVMERIGEFLGATVHTRGPRGRRRRQWTIQMTGRKVLALIRLIRPHLIVKRRQADLLLQLPGYGNGVTRAGRRGGRARTPEQDAAAEQIWQDIKQLNGNSGPRGLVKLEHPTPPA